MSYEVRFSRTGSVTPSDRGFSLRGVRTEGGGHKPVFLFLQHFSGEAPGDSGASPREAASWLPDPLEQRTPGSGSSAAQGDGMASRWFAAYLQATTTRQKSQLSSDRTNQVIVKTLLVSAIAVSWGCTLQDSEPCSELFSGTWLSRPSRST